ncbi:sulfite reductase flavoprotein subunit alpha [Microbulbifer halophilus]|uniref:NADPH--hemoprotein reductase n=1 Tax=Microbulbifer halophilus TaxID=453963 RepID=A0ABW5E7P7_9GAMM|nr:sulfite reductase flavoprotein subunit alpha [Microbulbifer halophilus]MCW8125692.1 sulfite reductase flavoprotein subunit alpha [Microbulbifer halophilus]
MTEFQRTALAAAAVIAWLGWCLWLYWRGRRADAAGSADGVALVAYASQGGTAETLARKRARGLETQGEVQLLPLNRVSRETLLSTRRALFVVSTYGDGEAPDNGQRFARSYLNGAAGQSLDLSHLSYSVVALGDRTYANFCAFGQAVYEGLAAMGARALEPLVRIDSGAPEPIRNSAPAPAPVSGNAGTQATEIHWQLTDRQRLNAGSPGDPLYRLVLRACGPSPAWRAGDVLVVRPRRARQQVDRWLERQGLDGSTWARVGDRTRPLAEWLSERQLPGRVEEPGALLRGEFADWPLLPQREYSVASRPEEGRLILLVRRQLDGQGHPGLGSGWLTRHCPSGDFVIGHIRTNTNCHTPDHRRPILLVGAGSGLAGLRAQLAERALCGNPGKAWLLYGERCPDSDRHLADEIAAWRESGMLARCDRVFSRDGGGYVQHLLEREAEELISFISRGADIYVCGSKNGMGEGVHAALQRILGSAEVQSMLDSGRYRRDLY